ncbi:protein ImuA [Oxalobacteraceae bacterium GrIS 1.11]
MLCTPLPIVSTPGPAARLALAGVWRASELAVSRSTTCPTGHAALDAELPNGGWPRSALLELLIQQSGIGEMQLLRPALAQLSKRQRIALVHPPYVPQAMACKAWGMDTASLLWIKTATSADALWTAEQILKNGSCGAVILWDHHVRAESLRRLNLAAQSTDTWVWLIRPLSCGADASPSPLRIGLRPALGGISVDILKRRGPHCDAPLFIPLPDMPAGQQLLDQEHAPIVDHPPALASARSTAPALV